MKSNQELRELCKKLKPVIGNQAEALWHMYLAEDDLRRREIALEIEIIAEKILKNKSLADEQVLLPPPTQENSKGSFLIGDVMYNGQKLQQLFLREQDLTKQVGIFAATGEGKTNLSFSLALQLLKKQIPFLVIDWKRSWRNLLSLKEKYPELENVQIFTIGRDALPFFWNPFRPPPNSDRQLWIGTISETLEKSHLSGPGVAYFLNKIFFKLTEKLGDNFYPNFYDGLKEIERIKVVMRELQWKQSAQRIFQSFTIGSASSVFNSRNPIKLENLLNKPVIFELDLELPKPLRVFFSEIVLRWIHLYRLSQGETEQVRNVLFLEEAHNLFNYSGYYLETNSLENVYREIRAFGQGIVSITQHPSMLPIYLLGNCHTQIYLGLQHEDDIRKARKALFLGYEQEPYLNLLNVGEAIVKIKNRVDPCFVKIPLIPIDKGHVTDEWLRENTPANTSKNFKGYFFNYSDGQGVSKKGNLPSDKYGIEYNKKPESMLAQEKLLVDIYKDPFSPITQRYKRLKLNPKIGNKYKNALIRDGCIKPRNIITGKGWITLFELTQRAILILRDLGHDATFVNESIIHKFWKNKISQYYQAKGFEVSVEKRINGRPDIIAMKNDKKIAIEIETGMSDVIGNIQRALKAEFDEVVSVGTTEKVKVLIINQLNKIGISDTKIKVVSVMDISVG